MSSPFSDARKRQLARLGGAKPPTARAAIAIAKSQAYQDAADAPSTLRAYTADLANYEAWCKRHGFEPMPATPEIVGAYLAAAGEGYASDTASPRRCNRSSLRGGRPSLGHQTPCDQGDPPRHWPEARGASPSIGCTDHVGD